MTLALQRRIESPFETAVVFFFGKRTTRSSSTVQPVLTISTTLMRNGEAASRDSLSDFSLAMFAARVPRQTVCADPADRLD